MKEIVTNIRLLEGFLHRITAGSRKLRSHVLFDSIQIYLLEKLEPHGYPSLQLRFAGHAWFYDLDEPRFASTVQLEHAFTLSLRVWIDGGQERILAEQEQAMIKGQRNCLIYSKSWCFR